jgi:hypothetical protein
LSSAVIHFARESLCPRVIYFSEITFCGDFVNALGTIILLGLLSLVKGIFEDKITDVFSFSLNIGIYFKNTRKLLVRSLVLGFY